MSDKKEIQDYPPVMTFSQFVELLNINRKTGYKLIKNTRIPGVRRIGRQYRFYRDKVVEWLASGQGRVYRKRR